MKEEIFKSSYILSPFQNVTTGNLQAAAVASVWRSLRDCMARAYCDLPLKPRTHQTGPAGGALGIGGGHLRREMLIIKHLQHSPPS